MTTIPEAPPFRYDSPAPAQAEPYATHEITFMFVARAQVQEGTTEAHAIEYVAAHLESRKPDLHEDIYDELTNAIMRVHGRGVVGNKLMSCAAQLVQEDSSNAIKGMRVAS